MELTPRSRIQKMLDAIDSESNKENHSMSSTTAFEPVCARSNAYHSLKHAVMDTNSMTLPNIRLSEDESDVKAVQSRAGMIARLRGNNKVNEKEESQPDGNAYDRVKRQFMKRQEKEATIESEPTRISPQRLESRSEECPVGTSQHFVSSRHSSPTLFLPPDTEIGLPVIVRGADSDGSDSDLPNNAQLQTQLRALVARKREERLAKEKAAARELSAEDTAQSSYQRRSKKVGRRPILVESESDNDKEVGRKLTRQTRPTRKAGKKALQEMNRETQRMSRNMQLTHEAKTKTKYSTQDFFKRFNFRQSMKDPPDTLPCESASSSSAHVNSDPEGVAAHSTPPSSPLSIGEAHRKQDHFLEIGNCVGDCVVLNTTRMESSEESLPILEKALGQLNEKPTPTLISCNHESNLTSVLLMEQMKKPSVRQFAKSVKTLGKPADSDDDDLEIIKPGKPSRLAVFDQLPILKARDSHSLHALRALAHLNTSDSKQRRSKDSMTSSELRILLHRRAKEQARHERDEKIQALKEKGVLVQTAEEKERDQMQLETMLEKARKEADELRRKEKVAAKQAGRDENGELHLPDSDGEEEEWQASDEDGDIELSGSEDEGVAPEEFASEEESCDEEIGEEDATTDCAERAEKILYENRAVEDAGGVDGHCSQLDDDELKSAIGQLPCMRARRKTIVVSDDEDVFETSVHATPSQRGTTALTLEASTSDAFGFARTKPAPLDLSQVFAGTMASSPTQADGDKIAMDSQQDSLAFLRELSLPELPGFDADFMTETQDSIVPCSQYEEAGNEIYNETQQTGTVNLETHSQMLLRQTQVSEVLDPTQDVGFQALLSPSQVQASCATVDTLPLLCTVQPESPVIKKKGRLRRRIEATMRHWDGEVATDEQEQQAAPDHGHFEISANAFDIMRNASKKPTVPIIYDKSMSKAKEMVDDQAEESEDEYAGLGGASDEEGIGELDEETKMMINDDGNEKVDEREMAAYFA